MSELGLTGRLLRALYLLLFLPAAPFILLYWLGRQDSRQRLGEYLGRGPEAEGEDLAHCIWVHAVSVGEVAAAQPVLRALANDGHRFFLTTTISDAAEAAERHRVRFVGSSFLPVDLPFALDRFVRELRPRALVISETDLWPNLLLDLKARGVPVFLVNGRISAKMARSWRAFRSLGAPALDALTMAWVQTGDDRERLISMGYAPDRVVVAGNTKYEMGAPPPLPGNAARFAARVEALDRAVIVAGSTHAPEEEILLEVTKGCPGARPLLVLVPRNPRRGEEVLTLAREAGRRVGLFSEVAAMEGDPGVYDVLVVDVMGLLAGLYALADIAYVGGGFGETGGHNFLEAAWHGCPIVGGPNWRNFENDVAAFVREGAFRRCADRHEVQDAIWALLEQPGTAADVGARARGLLERNQSASQVIVEGLRKALEADQGPWMRDAGLT